jgi:hypothetical protein
MAVGRTTKTIISEDPGIQSTDWFLAELRKRANEGMMKRSRPGRFSMNHGMAAVHHSGESLDARIMTAKAVMNRHALRFKRRLETDGIYGMRLPLLPPYSFQFRQFNEEGMFQRGITEAGEAP